MTKLTQAEVMHVADLAKLKLTATELTKLSKQLSVVVDYFDGLNEANIANTDPTHQTTGIVNNLRKDSISASDILPKSDALSGTEESHNAYFKVPMILEGRSDK